MLRPDTPDMLCDLIAQARASGEKLEIRGGGSKAEIGAPRTATILDMRGFTGIIDYDPAELVLTARAGTPLTEIEAALAERNQMLAFDPWDHGPLFGHPAGGATIGGVIAAGVAGPRRLSAGGARDHLLGFTAVSGKAERFVAGGKVVKNVTGFDLSKLLSASWGRIAALTEVSLKVLPRPRVTLTLASEGLSAALVRTLMLSALGSASSVAAAAYLPKVPLPQAGGARGGQAHLSDDVTTPTSQAHPLDRSHVPPINPSRSREGERSITLLRLEGFGPSVEAHAEALIRESGHALAHLPDEEAAPLWGQVRTPAHIESATLWRTQLPATASAALIEELEQQGANCLIDWGGSLLWIGWDGPPDLIRPAVEAAGGHAMLVRASEGLRARIPAQHPRDPGLATLEARVRRAFDPDGVFETGRFGATI